MKKIKIKEGFTGQRSVELPKAIIDMQENDPLVSTLFVTYIGYYPKAHHQHSHYALCAYILCRRMRALPCTQP